MLQAGAPVTEPCAKRGYSDDDGKDTQITQQQGAVQPPITICSRTCRHRQRGSVRGLRNALCGQEQVLHLAGTQRLSADLTS